MTLGSFGLAFLAGLLSTLSPCVLPLLPIVLGAAASEHRFGAVALAVGLAASFVAIGLFFATIGFSIGLDAGVFRTAGAIAMILIGAVLAVPSFQERLAFAGGPISDFAQARPGGASPRGIGGQFGVGLTLGAVWTPCAGPTLGAAAILAAQRQNLGQVALIMLLFAVGAAVPLLAIGLLSREAFTRWRGRLLLAGRSVRMAYGGLLAAIGLLIVSGYDQKIETLLVKISPHWLTALTARF